MNSDNTLFFQTHPELKNILEAHGSKTIMEYITFVNDFISKGDFSFFDQRQEDFFAVYQETLKSIFDERVIRESIETLKKNRLISTADHQGVISHPFFLSSTYARTLYAQKVGQGSVVTFPCASISLSNSSFPRGLIVHDRDDVEKKIYFKSLVHKLNPVFCEEKIERDGVQKMYDTLSSITLEKEMRKKILSVFKDIFFSEKFLSLESFDEQCTYGSLMLWKYVPTFENIDLIYVSQEKVVTDLIIKKHLGGDTLIHSLLFDETYHALFVRYFDGITGAFDIQAKKGTQLFWGVRAHERVALFIQENKLIDSNGDIFLIIETEEIKKALQERRIMPSMPLVFIVLSFYYGFVCGGGFSQVDYLGSMKNAWMNMLRDVGENSETDQVEKIPTNILLGDYATIQSGDTKKLRHAFHLIMKDSAHTEDIKKIFLQRTISEDMKDGFTLYL